MSEPIPEQVDRYMEMMAFQDLEKLPSLSEKVVRHRLQTAIVVAKMVQEGVDVFSSKEDVAKSMEDYNAGRYYTLGKLGLERNPDWPKEANDE